LYEKCKMRTICKNCGQTLRGKYCHNCGQVADTGRVDPRVAALAEAPTSCLPGLDPGSREPRRGDTLIARARKPLVDGQVINEPLVGDTTAQDWNPAPRGKTGFNRCRTIGGGFSHRVIWADIVF
jgi:hypothetical protein